ncbi:hypothetical protein PDE_09912 [Penicillium oxalicum 114-2]|uniref:Major facilitator superfamily (MFS) profile domain-containing protein n=1 Tax=Penicillium oxalicum (strain 114-2 / CGMCC 5302) TaxID=933388 RepID=S8BI86_PENO1|nr:hypothetical protein PDE_09912 [Penicillium oxalicum 114-2]
MAWNRGVNSVGYSWRSATWFTITCIAIALFSTNFLYSYIVPILPVMIRDILHIDESLAQYTTSLVLSVHAFVGLVTGIPIGYIADKISSRQVSFLAALTAEAIGTILVMIATNVPILLIGRSIQAIGGNGAWIVGLATVADTVGQENTGKVLGGISSFFNSGLLLGPMLSGTLLQLFGYWPTWIAALAVLVIDIIMRLIMIEDRSKKGSRGEASRGVPSEGVESGTVEEQQHEQDVNERTALISPSSQPQDDLGPKKSDEIPENFYKVILTNPRALTGLICHFTAAFILVTFDTTLPLYVTTEFRWGPAEVSLMFLILQLPSLVFSTFVGILKDRVGTRGPTALGFISNAVFLALAGIPTHSSGHTGRIIYMVAIAGVGIGWTLTGGCGIIEITHVMKELEDERPGRFGPNSKLSSGYSITKICFTLGTLLAPVATGFMTRTLGYSYMSYSVGILSFVVGVLAAIFLGRRPASNDHSPEH